MTTLNQFAWQLGAHTRITLAHSLVWHKAYLKADTVTRAAWRNDWIANFLSGNLEITVAQAEKIMAKSRTERTATQQNAYRAAEMKFKYHIVRTTSSATEPKPTVRISAAERAAFSAFVAACGGNVSRARTVFDALK